MIRVLRWNAGAFIVALMLVLLPGTVAAEAPSALKIMQEMEKTISAYKDQTMEVALTIIDVDGSKKSYDFVVIQKGEKSLARFTSGEVKGMATLIVSPSRTYVFLPGLNKVRRVASHAMNQGFAGSDFAPTDLAVLKWSDLYDVKIQKSDDTHWYLDCRLKEGKQAGWPRVVMKVNRKSWHQDGVEYYEASGKMVKRLENSNPITFPGGNVRNSNILMTDVRTGHATSMVIKAFRANEGLPDSTFTVRELQWGQ